MIFDITYTEYSSKYYIYINFSPFQIVTRSTVTSASRPLFAAKAAGKKGQKSTAHGFTAALKIINLDNLSDITDNRKLLGFLFIRFKT